jgi:hypothetical protein
VKYVRLPNHLGEIARNGRMCMFTTFFAWLRKRSEQAVLAGINDAARQLEDNHDLPSTPAQLAWHRDDAPDEEVKPARKAKSAGSSA